MDSPRVTPRVFFICKIPPTLSVLAIHGHFGYTNIITRWMEVKKLILITSVSVAVVAISATSLFALTKKEETTPLPSTVTVQTADPKPVESKEIVETVNEPPKVETVQETPVEAVTVPTNEQLIEQYNWNRPAYGDSIRAMIRYYPSYFTDELREASFKYIDDVSPSEEDGGITYFYIHTRSVGYKKDKWIELGTRAGVDTSLYE